MIELDCPVDVLPSGTRGPDMKILVPFCSTRLGTSSFFVKFGVYWNKLPNEIATASSLQVFKRDLQNFDLLSLV